MITVTLPFPGNRVGPGSSISAVSDFIGPLPIDTTWRFTCSVEAEGTNGIWAFTTPFVTLSTSVRWGDDVFPNQTLGFTMPTTPQAAFLTVQLFQPGNVVIDTATIPVTYDATSTLWDLDLIIQRQVKQGQALVPAESEALTRADVASQFGATLTGLSQVFGGVTDALTRPALYFLCREVAALGQTGTGSLLLPTQTKTTVVAGLTWTWAAVPPEVGRRNGFVPTYAGRPLQLVTQFQLDHNLGATVWDEVTEWNVDNVAYIFRRTFPSAVGFWIDPGFSVDFRWLRFCLLP